MPTDPEYAAHLRRWRAERGIAEPDPQPGRHTPTPDGVVAYCDRVITTRPAPVMLALVVMGRLTLAQVAEHRQASALLDELYDDAEENENTRLGRIEALMRNDLALAQLRQLRRRPRAA